MVKTTIRDSEEALEVIENELTRNNNVFDNKSDFYRFARDYTLNALFDDYKPIKEDFSQNLSQLEKLDEEGPLSNLKFKVGDSLDTGIEYFLTERAILYDETINEDEKIDMLKELNKRASREKYKQGEYANILL